MMKKIIAAALLLFAFAAHAQNQVNLPITLAASAARTTTTFNTADQTNASFTKLSVIINVSAYSAGTFTPHIQAKDPVSGNYYDLLVGASITSATTSPIVLTVGTGVLAVPNVAAQIFLPRTWRFQMAGTVTTSVTYSVGGFLGN